MALVFFNDPEAPVRCGLELSRMLRSHPGIPLRMGIHSGPIYRVADINANLNVAGGGINIAQRVMDCGDAGHILVSKSTADVLSQISNWAGSVKDLGEAEVKHGVRVHLFNLSTEDAGNPEVPRKLQVAARPVEVLLSQTVGAEELAPRPGEPSPGSTASPILLIGCGSYARGAKTYVDDELVGTINSVGNLRISSLSAGEHIVRLSLAGHHDHERSVQLVAGKTSVVYIVLNETATYTMAWLGALFGIFLSALYFCIGFLKTDIMGKPWVEGGSPQQQIAAERLLLYVCCALAICGIIGLIDVIIVRLKRQSSIGEPLGGDPAGAAQILILFLAVFFLLFIIKKLLKTY